MSNEAVELLFSSRDEGVEETVDGKKLIWKDILREGNFAITPGRRKKMPFKVVAEGKSSATDRIISMTDITAAFEAKAFPEVTIPDGHPKDGDDSALNNTGYVEALRIVKKPIKMGDETKKVHVLQGGLGFTEPDVAAKVRRGTVPNVSSGVLFDFTRKHDDKTFACALNHVALTKNNWIPLDGFKKVYASDDNFDDDIEITSAEFEDGEQESGSAEVVWNERDGSNWIREALTAAITPDPVPVDNDRPYVPRPEYYVEDVAETKGLALVKEWFKGDSTRFVVPFTKEGDEVKPAPQHRWVEGRDALIAASDDKNDDNRVNFEDVSADTAKEKLGIVLSEMVGDEHNFSVQELTLDRRCRVKNEDSNAIFEVEFAEVGGRYHLAPPSEWERINASDETDAKQSVSAPAKKVVDLYDESTAEGRVLAARQRRRHLIAGKIR